LFLFSDVLGLAQPCRGRQERHIYHRFITTIGRNEKINGNLLIFQEERDPEKEDELELKRSLLYRDSAYDSDPEYRYGLVSMCGDLFYS